MHNPYNQPGQPYGGPLLTKKVIRIMRPTLARCVTAFVIIAALMYSVSVPLTFYWIQDSGMGSKPLDQLSIGEIIMAVVMITLLWAPLTLMTMSWFLTPLAVVLAVVCASVRRVPVPI